MKKLIFFFVVILTWGSANAFAFSIFNLDEENHSIHLTKMEKEDLEELRSRSIGPDVSAYLDYDMGQIEVIFNNYIGIATIYLIDGMGKSIGSLQCNTETEWEVYFPLPSDDGAYSLLIDSTTAEYRGDFIL